MSAVLRFDSIVLDASSSRVVREADGCLIVRGRFARTGLQDYSTDRGERWGELRPEDEVAASGPSFEGTAITDLHPDAPWMVTPGSFRTVARGHVESVSFDVATGWLSADFYIADAELRGMVERGERVELSAGYYAELDEAPGLHDGKPYQAIQRRITGNHVALLVEGTARAGRGARLLDSTKNQRRGAPRQTSRRDMEELEKARLEIERLEGRGSELGAEIAPGRAGREAGYERGCRPAQFFHGLPAI